MSKRLAALLLAAPLAFAPAASAKPIIEGCWGAASATYCDPELRITPIKGDPSPTPICAGTCTYVGVPTVDPVQQRYEVCLDYTTPQGYAASECVVDVDRENVSDVLQAIADRIGCDEPKCELVDLSDLGNPIRYLDTEPLCGVMAHNPAC
ncbi:MAG TPA: hypothetical protein VGX28_04800 [Frankiaceae bacterium]|jgi:hypothetical protein|nr:hypothetical protein [Frankiaceae bacterium]